MRKPQPYKQSAEPQPVAQPVRLPDTRRGSPLPWVSVTPGLAYGRYLTDQVEDNARNESNRFQVAATINQTLGADAIVEAPTTRRPPVSEEARDLRPTLGMAAARTDSSPCGSSTPRSVSKLRLRGVGRQPSAVRHPGRAPSALAFPTEGGEPGLAVRDQPSRPPRPGIVHAEIWPGTIPTRSRCQTPIAPSDEGRDRDREKPSRLAREHRSGGRPLKCCGDVLIDFHDRTASDH